jgi:hypothetical protein
MYLGADQQHIPVSLAHIQEKTISLNDAEEEEVEEEAAAEVKPSVAAIGWFHQFQKQAWLQKRKNSGERTAVSLQKNIT